MGRGTLATTLPLLALLPAALALQRAAPPRLCTAAVSPPPGLQRDPEFQLQAAQRAQLLLQSLPEAGATTSSYTEVLRAFSEASMPEECTALLRRMRRTSNARPSLECYGLVIAALTSQIGRAHV